MSKPAHEAKSAIDELRDSWKSVVASTKQAQSSFSSVSGFMKSMQASVQSLRKSVAGLGDEHEKAGKKGEESLLGSLVEFEAIKEAAELAVDVVKELYAGFVQLERAEKVFSVKSGKEGVAQLNEVTEAVKNVGLSMEDALSLATTFGRAFPTKDAKELSSVVLDIKANFGQTVDEAKGVAGQFEALSHRDVVGDKQTRQVIEFFGQFKVADEVAKATGRAVGTITDELKKGRLPAEQLILGIEQAQKDIAGTSVAGEAAQKSAAKSVEAQIGRIKNGIAEVGEAFAKDLFGAGDDPAAGFRNVADAIDTFVKRDDVKAFIGEVADDLKALAGVAVDVVVPAFHVVGKVVGAISDGIKFLKSGTEGANATLAGLAGGGVAVLGIALYALVPPLVASAAAAASAAVAFIAASLPILAIVAAVALVAVGIYELVTHWDAVKGFFINLSMTVGHAVIDGFNAAIDWIKALPGKMLDLGKDVVMGLVNGITGAGGYVLDAVEGLGKKAIDGFKGVLGIHSPSVVMEGLGSQVPEGAALGIEGGSDHVQQAAKSMASDAVPQGGSGGRSSGRLYDFHVSIENNFHGAQGGGAETGFSLDALSVLQQKAVEDAVRAVMSQAAQQS